MADSDQTQLQAQTQLNQTMQTMHEGRDKSMDEAIAVEIGHKPPVATIKLEDYISFLRYFGPNPMSPVKDYRLITLKKWWFQVCRNNLNEPAPISVMALIEDENGNVVPLEVTSNYDWLCFRTDDDSALFGFSPDTFVEHLLKGKLFTNTVRFDNTLGLQLPKDGFIGLAYNTDNELALVFPKTQPPAYWGEAPENAGHTCMMRLLKDNNDHCKTIRNLIRFLEVNCMLTEFIPLRTANQLLTEYNDSPLKETI